MYQLNPESLKVVDSWLEPYRVFWRANLTSLKNFVETEYARESRSGLQSNPAYEVDAGRKRKE